MTSVRLTKTIRETIYTRVIKYKFQEQVTELLKKHQKLAEMIYQDMFTKDEHKLLKSLPQNWLAPRQSISYNLAGQSRYICFNGIIGHYREYYNQIDFEKPEQIEFNFPCQYETPVIESGTEIYNLVNKLDNEADSLNEEIKKAKQNLWAALESVTTLNKLITEWEEIRPFCKDFMVTKANLPAVKVSELNKMLNLPKEENS